MNNFAAFNAHGIVYDNSPWRPGRRLNLSEVPDDEQRRLKQNLATKILSNGVEVLIKERFNHSEGDVSKSFNGQPLKKNGDERRTGEKAKIRSLLSSKVSTIIHQSTAPLRHIMQNNYIIKTCFTTFTYLTTFLNDQKSTISTFETVISVVSTETVKKMIATEYKSTIRATKTKYEEAMTLQPTNNNENANHNLFSKLEQRIDSYEGDTGNDFIQPSETSHPSICLNSPCLCSHSKTEALDHLQTKLPPRDTDNNRYPFKTPTPDETLKGGMKNTYFDFDSAPSDKIVEKYTEVINDYADEKDVIKNTELLTNEQAPDTNAHIQTNKPTIKPSKPPKNKFEVSDLLKLSSIGIKSLSQLAPVFEKMTGGLIKRPDNNKTTTTVKPVVKLTGYSVDKRLDSEDETGDTKQGNFPIYIPVDELETSESKNIFVNTSLHQNLPWETNKINTRKNALKQIHESPLVNGGIPISPGEVITANSDVIVGKPAVGGPLTLSASGIKIQTFPRPDTIDINQDGYHPNPETNNRPSIPLSKDDLSFDLRPPQPPNKNFKNAFHDNRPFSNQRPKHIEHKEPPNNFNLYPESNKDVIIHNGNFVGPQHGRPAFLDYIPSLANKKPMKHEEDDDEDISDSSASSSELVATKVKGGEELNAYNNKPFLVDVQPSKVANVLIPHGSATAMIFAGASEPHKTGEYLDEPLPYQGPGYFGSFNIDTPKMTLAHNVPKDYFNYNKLQESKPKKPDSAHRHEQPHKETANQNKFYRHKNKGNNKRPYDIPPPTSNQESHFHIGPHIASYNPDVYRPNGHNLEKYNNFKGNKYQKIIDKEYEKHLAVPPPPPQMKFNYDTNLNQRPVYHTKPVQDTNVFLNVQHPIPSNPIHNTENLPPQVTSEVYYAAQGSTKDKHPPNKYFNHEYSTTIRPLEVFSNQKPNINNDKQNNQDIKTNEDNLNQDYYTVTLNTATNVGENPLSHQSVVGSSISVPIDESYPEDVKGTGIPIGTNFAIKVEDKPAILQHNEKPQVTIDHTFQRPELVLGSHNQEQNKQSTQSHSYSTTSKPKTTHNHIHYPSRDVKQPHIVNVQIINAAEVPLYNGHANGNPMIYESTTKLNKPDDIKPVTEEVEEDNIGDDANRPSKTIQNIPINSHQMYSSKPYLPVNIDMKNINKIKIPSITQNVIPLIPSGDKHEIPNFGQKIKQVDIPPLKWNQNNGQKLYTDREKVSTSSIPVKYSHFTTPKYTHNQQQVYDIPEKKYNELTSTTAEDMKPVFEETSEEIYDGKEPTADEGASSETMTVPKISSIEENSNKSNSSTSILLDQFIETKKHQIFMRDNENSGSQTEKPFKVPEIHSLFSTNEILKPYNHVPMKPSPFRVSQYQDRDKGMESKNQTKPIKNESTLDLNIGEEFGQSFVSKVPTTEAAVDELLKVRTTPKPRHRRPVFSLKLNATLQRNNSEFRPNIITNSVSLKDRHPITIVNITNEKPSIQIYDTISTSTETNVSDIIDLLPPPVVKEITNSPGESIEGMNPPPPKAPTTIKNLPSRGPGTLRPFPSRSPPPYRTKPVRTTRPTRPITRAPQKETERDDASTFRPMLDILKRRPIHRHPPFVPSTPTLPSNEIVQQIPVQEENDSLNIATKPTVVFPIPNSSGWVTPTSISFPIDFIDEIQPSTTQYDQPSKVVFHYDTTTSTEKSEQDFNVIPLRDLNIEVNKKPDLKKEENNGNTDILRDQDQDAKGAKLDIGHAQVTPDTIRPTKVVSQTKTDRASNTVLYPPRKEYKPVIRVSKPKIEHEQSLVEGSEANLDVHVIKPTEILEISKQSTDLRTPNVMTTSTFKNIDPIDTTAIKSKPSDTETKLNVLPIKTEYKTKAITLTKTLSEPAETVSTTRFVTLTHTATVTQTETSLVSLSAGATTQTLILTNTQTSTLVDIVTEIHTHVLPTTIRETVTRSIPIIKPTIVTRTHMKTENPFNDFADEVNYILPKNETNYHIKNDGKEEDTDNFLIVMNKSQNGGPSPAIETHGETEFDNVIRVDDVEGNKVSQVLFGEILLAGTPYLETAHVDSPTVIGYSKECQPDCKASRNERCQRVGGIMKCVCRPGFARMFPERPCKPTYTYSLRLALGRKGDEKLTYRDALSVNSSADYRELSEATHEGIKRMIMQSDLRDVFHGVQINGFAPVTIPKENEKDEYDGVVNDFYVQLSDNAHESRLKEVIEKYLRTNNFSLGGTEVYAARELVDKLEVSDFNECLSPLFHDCSEHSECFNLRGTYTCSCKEGYSDLSVSALYPGRICSAEPIGCETCNFHGSCYNRDDDRVLCECFQWYAGPKCQINLKVVLISLGTLGAVLVAILVACVATACSRRGRHGSEARERPPRSIVATCIQNIPAIPQGAVQTKHHISHDRRALINERTDSGGDSSSIHNASLPYIPAKKVSHASNKGCKKISIAERADNSSSNGGDSRQPCVMIPRAKLFQSSQRRESREVRDSVCRKQSVEISTEEKLIHYLEAGGKSTDDLMRRKPSAESSNYSANKDRHYHKHPSGALISAGFKVSTTVKPGHEVLKEDDMSSVNKAEYDRRYDSLGNYSQEDIGEWTDAERRIGELTLSEARSIGGTLPASTGRAASSTRLTQQDAHTMAERDLGSTFLLPHVHLYKPEMISNASDVSEFDSQ